MTSRLAPRVVPPPSAAVGASRRGSGRLTNLRVALRLSLGTNWRGLAAAVLAVVGCMYLGTLGVDGLYPAGVERTAYASIAGQLTAQIALQGPADALTTLGGIAVFELGWFLVIAVALINIVVVVRNTRAQEAFGRLELLRAGRFGVHSNSVAVLVLAVATNTLIAGGVAAAMVLAGAAVRGAVAFGIAMGSTGIVFAAVAVLAAQITAQARGAYGIACTVLGLSYLSRALGDASEVPALRLASPLGWAQHMHPFGETRWWPVPLCAVGAALLVLIALRLESVRDLGAGLAAPRPGAPAAGALMKRPLGLAFRIHRGALTGWLAALLVLGAGFGAAGADVAEISDGVQGMLKLLTGFNVDVVDGFLAMVTLLCAMAAAGAAVSTVLRIRQEELAGRADLLLAGRLPRWRLAATHIATAIAASVVLLGITGCAIGLVHGVRTGDLTQAGRVAVAALAQLPAILFLVGCAVLLLGVRPALTWLVWVVLAESAIVSILGPSMRLPTPIMNLSVFHHVPHLPGVAVNPIPLTVLCLAGLAATGSGVFAFTRRDLG
ncbi:ABC transporter permease [Nocardia sp. XZ_19_385]|uniref:ABC transporter permease n=1 Tax=Nocardia sp. XZ_19_385 TaxID=2769488 RepID=UPI001890A72E|nr:hypothetical protein [Nocardia sp. XZ_19_385]